MPGVTQPYEPRALRSCDEPVLRSACYTSRLSPSWCACSQPAAACLLAQAREDPDAFAAFYDAYSERVLVFLTRRVLDVDTAFDLLSETFATALEQRGKFRGEHGRGGAGLAVRDRALGALALLARTAVSSAPRSRASACRCPGLSDPEIERIEELAGHRGAGRASSTQALRALPEDQRRAVELRVVCECGYDDVAGRLGVSEQTARARVSRGLRALSPRIRAGGRGVTRHRGAAGGTCAGRRSATSRPARSCPPAPTAHRSHARARPDRQRRGRRGDQRVRDRSGGAGHPRPDPAVRPWRRRPTPDHREAARSRVALPLGVAVYETQDGHTCALPGVVNGSSLGDLVDGTFRPYAADRVGTCNVPQRPTIDSATVAGKAVVFGLAAPKTRTVVLRATGERFRVGPDRAFLFVVPTRGPAEVDMRE